MPRDLLDLPIAEFKRQLANGEDFSAIMKFFFDNFVDEQQFMDASYPVEIPKSLATAVGKLFTGMNQSRVSASSWQIGEASMLNLIHGTITTTSGSAVVVWATDISIGLLGMPNPSGQTLFARITIAPAPTKRTN